MHAGIAMIVPMALAWAGEPEPRLFDPGRVGVEDGSTGFELERHRIRRHLALVEATLREETPADLPEAQARARAALLDELHAYAERGIFPRNDDFSDRRMPYFIDDVGTACAVGHLMIVSGSADLAYAIARDENNDFVAEIDHPGVGAWLDSQGLTLAEAAWIQPSYGPCGFVAEVVCGVDGNTYACETIAVECAMVEVAHVGACESQAEVIGEEICSATDDTTSTDEGESTDDESTNGDEPAPAGRGCSIGSSPVGSGFAWALLVLVAIRRRSSTR